MGGLEAAEVDAAIPSDTQDYIQPVTISDVNIPSNNNTSASVEIDCNMEQLASSTISSPISDILNGILKKPAKEKKLIENIKEKVNNKITKKKMNIKESEDYVRTKFVKQIKVVNNPVKHMKCTLCTKVFFNRTDAMDHANNRVCRVYKKPKVVETKCPACGAIFPSKSEFTYHYKKEHARPEQCSQCPGLKLKSLASLKRHLRSVHSDQESFQCSVCPKKYKRKDTLLHHVLNKHQQEGRENNSMKRGNRENKGEEEELEGEPQNKVSHQKFNQTSSDSTVKTTNMTRVDLYALQMKDQGSSIEMEQGQEWIPASLVGSATTSSPSVSTADTNFNSDKSRYITIFFSMTVFYIFLRISAILSAFGPF